MNIKTMLSSCVLLAASTISFADSEFTINESASTDDWNPSAPWKLPTSPAGITQTLISGEESLNIYPGGRQDWHDMNTVNETGDLAGRFLYRTHEVRLSADDSVVAELGGAVSVVDLSTGETTILTQVGGLEGGYTALDGIRWTPWETLLFAEEAAGGRLFEIILNGDKVTAASVIDRPAVGRLAHEGIEVDSEGNVYVVDEHRGRTIGCEDVVPCGGGVYKFVPTTFGDLSTGELFVLHVNGADGVGQGSWVGPIDPLTARVSGTEAGGQSYQRPEDMEIIGNTLYVAITEGMRDVKMESGVLAFQSELYEGRVIAVNLDTLKVSNFIKPGLNTPVEIGKPGDEGHQSGFDSVDNLAEGAGGILVMIEDNKPSDIWYASTQDVNTFGAANNVFLFASLTDPSAEGSGIYFSPTEPNKLYVNVQHSEADDGDGTWAIELP